MPSTPPVNTLTGGVENYVGGVKKFWGASHPPQANLCTRPCKWFLKILKIIHLNFLCRLRHYWNFLVYSIVFFLKQVFLRTWFFRVSLRKSLRHSIFLPLRLFLVLFWFSDLYYCLPWSHGSLGFLVGLELEV